MKKNKLIIYLRWIILAIILLFITIAAYLHQVNGGGVSPSIHALCPYAGLESLYKFFSEGNFISKVFSGTMLLFSITVILALVFRRSFCGLLCPFGALQEFFGKIGEWIFKKKFIIPSSIDKPLRYLKYVILVITLFYAWKTAGLWMAPYDPWSAYAHLTEGLENVWNESAIGLILLTITILGSVLYDRFFCKYICPMGAFYGLVSKLSPYKVVRNKNICINCGKCNKACPMNIDVKNSIKITTAECLNCQSCVLNCPKADALEIKQGKITIKPLVSIILVVSLFFGSILTLKALNLYNLLPEPIKAGEKINVTEIKGYMTIKEASEATQIELNEFYKKFQIPEDIPANTKMKEISNLAPDYSFDEVKESFN